MTRHGKKSLRKGESVLILAVACRMLNFALFLSRQYFGVLLLIFEWGTTWPFVMPDLPVEQIPFKDEIGKVVRTLILPTIFSNFQRARSGDMSAGNGPPAKNAPSGPDDA
jgi:hypothetical protein